MLQICEVIFGCQRAAELSAFLEGAMGEPCPCKQGRTCPLLPVNDDVVPVAETTSTLAAAQHGLVELADDVPLDQGWGRGGQEHVEPGRGLVGHVLDHAPVDVDGRLDVLVSQAALDLG